MTQDPPELDLLSALGHVDPPAPGVLDAARETLWSAVAHQMLAADPSVGQDPGWSRRSAALGADRPRQSGQHPPDPDA